MAQLDYIDPLKYALDKMDEKYFSVVSIYNKENVRASTRAMIRAYHHVYRKINEGFLVTGVEKTLYGPIIDPRTKKDSGYTAAGKLDVTLSELSGRKQNIILDHKFLSYAFDSDDIEHLKMAGQPCQYVYLGYLNGKKYEGIIWDVIVKPQLRRRKPRTSIIPGREEKICQKKHTVDGVEYLKGETIPATADVEVSSPGEPIDEFEERVYQTMVDEHERFFKRERVNVVPQAILTHASELYDWLKELDVEKDASRHLRNPDSCKLYNSWCKYLPLCLGHESEEDESKWKIAGSHHAELELPADLDPAKVITNSRMQVYRSCKLKHDRRYNKGLVQISEQVNDALYIGSAGHIGLEYLFKATGNNQRLGKS